MCVSMCAYECVLKSSANFSFAVFITLFYMAFGGVIIFVFVTAAAVAAADVSVIAIVCEHQQPLHLSIYIVYMCVRACVCVLVFCTQHSLAFWRCLFHFLFVISLTLCAAEAAARLPFSAVLIRDVDSCLHTKIHKILFPKTLAHAVLRTIFPEEIRKKNLTKKK